MKKIKGFTLIELIIVMAIISILMVGIMQMMKPIRSTFIDSTYYEMQRNTQNGMITYLTETLRYADNLGIYTSGNVSNAITKFKSDVMKDASFDNKKVHVITIDNKMNYTYNNVNTLRGRIVVNKPTATGYNAMWADNPATASARVALSEAYYGASSYSIAIVPDDLTKPTNMKITVASVITHSRISGRTTGTNDTGSIASQDQIVKTEGYIPLNNMSTSRADSGGFKTNVAVGGTLNTTTNGQRTYIVYTLPDEH